MWWLLGKKSSQTTPGPTVSSNSGHDRPQASDQSFDNRTYYSNLGQHASGQGAIYNINPQTTNPLLEELEKHCSHSAAFDSAARSEPPRCTESTRLQIIQNIEAWINDDGNNTVPSSLFWLYGGAGVGKSAIAQSLSESFQKKKQLAASFFFFRSDPSRNNGDYLIPTLVWQLVGIFNGMLPFIDASIHGNRAIFTKRYEIQIQELLIEPLIALQLPAAIPRLIVIDGLDECQSSDAQCGLLRVVAQAIREVPYPLRFLVTSRPEAHIMDVFDHDRALQAITVHRYNLSNDADADMDIRKFLEGEFAKICRVHRLGRHLPDPWPNLNVITSLVERSSRHFIYPSTVIYYIRSQKHRPDDRLEVILRLRPPQEGDRPYAQLDELYTLIFAGVESQGQLEKICFVLTIIYFGSVRVCTIEEILEMRAGDLDLLLDPILSLVSIDGDELQNFHTSLFDFLLDVDRCGQLPFHLSRALENRWSPSAAFDLAARFDPPRSSQSTRLRIMQYIEEWINGNGDNTVPSSLFWLYGGAGVGKSAIAQSLSESFHKKKQLAASFFFFRGDPSRNNGDYLIPTLISQLVRTFKGILPFIDATIRENPALFTRRYEIQIQELLIKPMLKLQRARAFVAHPRLIVIDGLDECLDPDIKCRLLRVIALAIRKAPYPLRFLVTSRPEAHIMRVFNHDPDLQAITVHTYNLSDDPDADMDIRKFLEGEFAKICQVHCLRQHLPDPWPNQNVITSLVERSSGHFIYASTVIRYIWSRQHRPDDRLEVILRLRPQEGDRPYAQLDELYTLIFAGVESEGQLEKICSVLVIVYFGSLRVCAIEEILEMRAGDLDLLLDPILSLVSIDGDELRILDKSLFDFLLDVDRSGQLPFHLSRALKNRWSPNAAFDPAAHFDPPRFTQSTRLRIIQPIEEWINNDGDNGVPSGLLWLYGDAGAGKSTIAKTLSVKFQEQKQLAASFFFIRSDPSRNNGDHLIPTLISQLVRTFKGIFPFIDASIRENPALFTKRYEIQIQELLIKPMLALKLQRARAFVTHPRLIVIDGLDECRSSDAQCELLRVIAQAILHVPYPLRFLVTSRPEAPIVDVFNHDRALQAITVHRYNLSDNAHAGMHSQVEEEFARDLFQQP